LSHQCIRIPPFAGEREPLGDSANPAHPPWSAVSVSARAPLGLKRTICVPLTLGSGVCSPCARVRLAGARASAIEIAFFLNAATRAEDHLDSVYY